MAVKPEPVDTARIVPTSSWVIPALPAWVFALSLITLAVSGTWFMATKVQSDTEFRDQTHLTHDNMAKAIAAVDAKNTSDTAATTAQINAVSDRAASQITAASERLSAAIEKNSNASSAQQQETSRAMLQEIREIKKGLDQLRFLYCVRDGKKCSPDGVPL